MIAAIGDVHGCAVELRMLLQRLISRFPVDKIVMLGDYVDRGPDSKGVLDIIRHWEHPTIEMVAIRGNHDQMMIEAVLYRDAEMIDPMARR